MVLLLAFCCSYFSYSEDSLSQDIQTTPNLIQPGGWQGCLNIHPGWVQGGIVGGPCPALRGGDGAFLFSYGRSIISQTHAVNQALSGTGIQIRGYHYSWEIKNDNAGAAGQSHEADPLEITVRLTSPESTVLESRTYRYSYRIFDWTTYSGTETYDTIYSINQVDALSIEIHGQDRGYWRGYYGPEIRNINLRLRYSVDQCAINPLTSADCPGHAQAYLSQQCLISVFFSPDCPGYESAVFNQQCYLNALYNPQCPGYTQATFDQKCSIDVFYNPQCPGYQAAVQIRLQQQACQANPQINPQCPGYESSAAKTQVYESATVIYQDPVAEASEVQVTSDLVVNSVIRPDKKITTESVTSTGFDLGTGLIIPGLRLPLPHSKKNRQDQQETNALTMKNNKQVNARGTQSRITVNPETQQQNSVIEQIANVPGFDAYSDAAIPDAAFYPTRDIYRGVVIRDNARAQRALSQRSDRLHQEMIDEQYRR